MDTGAPRADVGADVHGIGASVSAIQSNPIDPDAILNLVRLVHAQSQKLAEQWVPVTSQELEQEREAVSLKEEFPFRPEFAGLGADVTQTSDSRGKNVGIGDTEAGQLAKLREQMLGKKAARQNAAGIKRQPHQHQESHNSKKQKIRDRNSPGHDDEEDEEGGRTAAITSRRSKPQTAQPEPKYKKSAGPKPLYSGKTAKTTATHEDKGVGQQSRHDEESDGSAAHEPESAAIQKRKGSSFLDQILAERSKKKKKKKSKKGDA